MEYCKTNISNVQGLTFEKLDSSGNSLLDINIIGKLNIRTKALFEFQFKTGWKEVPPG